MRQMSTMGQIQSHDTIVWIDQGVVHLKVGGGAGQGLNVYTPLGWIEVERLQGTLLAEKFHAVDVFVAAVVPSIGVPFTVLVLHDTAQCLTDAGGGKIFRRNQHQTFTLTLFLILDDVVQGGVRFLRGGRWGGKCQCVQVGSVK